jgi:cytochrome c biogenesis protein CcmG/thiol:disulfide interchange protein DsbE
MVAIPPGTLRAPHDVTAAGVCQALAVEATALPARRRPWARWSAVAVALLFIALLIYGIAAKGTSDEIDSALADGRAPRAPAFTLEVLEKGKLPPSLEDSVGSALADGELSISELRGTPVVLNLWASWCTPCREESPRLREGWERLGPRGIAFLGLNIQDLREDARAFSKEFGLTYPSVRDARRGVADDYGATGIPETFFVDARGRVVAHVIGVVSAPQLAAGIRAAFSGQVAGTVTGGRSFDVR